MENNQKPIRNDKLLEAIKNMQENNSDENVNRMIDCVMEANFITPGNVSRPKNIAKNSGGNTVMQQQTQIQFQLIENQKGEKFFPAFTDQEEKAKWEQAKGKNDVIMTFDSYYQVLSEEQCNVMGFVINPFGRSVAFPKPMVMSLKQQKDERDKQQGLKQQSIGKDEKVHIGDPAPAKS